MHGRNTVPRFLEDSFTLDYRRRISGQEHGGRATNRGRIRQKSSKIYARLSYYNRCFRGFARCSAKFWISDVHWRHALSRRRDSFQLELERRLDREEPSNANSVDFSIVASTQVESVCQVFPTVIFFFSLFRIPLLLKEESVIFC